MNELIRKLTPPIELFIVLILGFGLFVFSSTRGFFVVTSNYNHSWTYKIMFLFHSMKRNQIIAEIVTPNLFRGLTYSVLGS